jgi:Fe2+ or Zn2+ uptake regulation protein
MEKIARMTAHIKSRGQRMTAQKRALLAVFAQHADRMLSIADIKGLLPADGAMDDATIYRNVENFTAIGLLETMADSRGCSRYTAFDGVHRHHFICLDCARIIGFPCDNPFWRPLAEQHQFTEAYHRIEVYGLCAHCGAQRADAPPQG